MLDSAGRWILQQADYRTVALLTLSVILGFLFYRHRIHGRWPSVPECISVSLHVLTLFSGFLVGAVFLLTKPPAIESLSPEVLSLTALVTVIAVFGNVGPKLLALFKPETDEPPRRE